MIRIMKSHERHCTDFGWLYTCWLFSFSHYYDPDNIQHGALRVFNDDVVQPGEGFPTHPHHEMEILTLVMNGALTHEDSMGNKTVIEAGDVQRMSAGTGIRHSEYNFSNEPVHFYQIWIFPDESRLLPSYDQRRFAGVSRRNTLLPVASGQGLPNVVTFHTDATIYLSHLDAGTHLDYDTDPTRRIFVYVTSGKLEINDHLIETTDQARIHLEATIDIDAIEDTEFVLIDVPERKVL